MWAQRYRFELFYACAARIVGGAQQRIARLCNHAAQRAFAYAFNTHTTRQFDNVANRHGHYENTGPEIFEQCDGKVDAFICAVGTGGTLSGTGMALKERNPDIIIALADPLGAALHSFYTTGEFSSWGESITEGIGQGRITANLENAPVDLSFQIPDEEALPICFDLLKEEGLCLGGSSGINVAGAIRLAKEIGPGKTIVTILADSGIRYQTKLFNPEFLRKKNLPVPAWLE